MKVGDIELAESNIFPEWDDVVKFVVSKAPLLLGAVIIVVVGFVLSNLVGKLVVKGMRARGIDPSIHTFIKTIVVLLLKFAVILSALSTMNVDVNSFIAAIGAPRYSTPPPASACRRASANSPAVFRYSSTTRSRAVIISTSARSAARCTRLK